MKKCNKCLEFKELDDFYKSGKYKDKIYYRSICKKCVNKDRNTYNIKYRKEHRDELNAWKRKWYHNRMQTTEIAEDINNKQRIRYPRYLIKRLYRNAKVRADKKNIPFNIELSDIVVPDICPILEIPLFTGSKYNYNNSPSLDRVDNTKGYIKGNVQVISNLANSMKNQATIEQLITFNKNILKYINHEDIVRTIENNESIESKDKEL
jgi:hypothetical protein